MRVLGSLVASTLLALLCSVTPSARAAPNGPPTPPTSAPPRPAAVSEPTTSTVAPARPLPASAAPKTSGPRIAITDLALEGDGASPALGMQLQDGFVLGLVRGGFDVADFTDVSKTLAASPELIGCESSPCLKRTGDLLQAPYALRVRVLLTGNNYRMTARLFSTRGAAPAALPIATLSRSCDVCTVNEAREAMIKLADGMRSRVEAHNAVIVAAPPAPPPAPSRAGPLLALGLGVAAVAGGAALIAAAGPTDKGRAAVGGTLLGAGLTTSFVGLFFTTKLPAASTRPSPPASPTPPATALHPGLLSF
ncbi:MAG TPA: hypothetical protein VGG33_05605 [Polyangia bacterium]